MQIIKKRISELIPDPSNARKHDDKNLAAIKGSLAKFGQQKPIVIDDKNVVLAGNGTLSAAIALGWTEIGCVVSNLKTNTEKTAFALADNRTSELAEWDADILSDALKSLGLDDFDVTEIGFELPEIIEPIEPGCDEDEVPEVTDTRAKPGDVWILGNHRVMCGDATNIQHMEKLMNTEKADMVFTDPPYGYSYESNRYKKGNPHGMLDNDDKILDFIPCVHATMEENSAIYICASHQTAMAWRPLIDKHFHYKNLIVWKKNNWSMGDLSGAFAGQHELIFFAHKGRVKLRGERSRDVWEFDRDPPEHHPTQKPVELVEFAISKACDKLHRVLDPFLGSGSTLIACEKTSRKCFGMEIDPHYVDVILSRWEKFSGKTATLLGQPES